MNKSIVKSYNELGTGMDDILTDLLLNKTIGEICRTRETARNARSFVACDLILKAVGDGDVGLISLIVRRVDGGIPKAEEKDSFANLVGNAIDHVLDGPADERNDIDLDNDLGITALAKAIIFASIQITGTNITRRRDRQLAAEILLNRIGGAKSNPVKNVTEVEIEEPDWAKSLPGK